MKRFPISALIWREVSSDEKRCGVSKMFSTSLRGDFVLIVDAKHSKADTRTASSTTQIKQSI
jgi:hypothetical protein